MTRTLTGTLHRNVITLDTGLFPLDGGASQRVRVIVEPLSREERVPNRTNASAPSWLRELVRSGKARAGQRNSPELYPRLDPVLKHGTAQELLDDDRGDR